MIHIYFLLGLGQLIALELLSVTGGECFHVPGEARDITAQHFVCFDSQNPHSTTEKQLIIRNSTYVATNNIQHYTAGMSNWLPPSYMCPCKGLAPA